MKAECIIFDLDDTLTSETSFAIDGYATCADFIAPLAKLDKEEILKIMLAEFQRDKKNVFNRALEKIFTHTPPTDLLKECINLYRSRLPRIKFYADVIPFLQECRARNLKLAIVTDGLAITQRQKLKALNAENFFDVIVVTAELGEEFYKPSTKPFELVATKCNVKTSNCIYCGDNPKKDFFAASKIPLNTVQITRTDSIYAKEAFLGGVHPTLFQTETFANFFAKLDAI